jgi:hypothetical protein
MKFLKLLLNRCGKKSVPAQTAGSALLAIKRPTEYDFRIFSKWNLLLSYFEKIAPADT